MAKIIDYPSCISTEELIESASFRVAGDFNTEYLGYNFSILNFLGSGGIVVMVRIFERTGLNSWREVHLHLGFWQRLLNLVDNYWPPEEALEVCIEDGVLVMYYCEPDSPYEIPFWGMVTGNGALYTIPKGKSGRPGV